MYVCVYMYYCVYVCILCMCVVLCMYVYYVCVYYCVCMCIVYSVRALSSSSTYAACVGVPVLVYCMYVVSMVVVMGSPRRTYVVCGIVHVSIVSLGGMYCNRCVLLLIIVYTNE